jgi:hypothetical protein
VAMLVGKNIMDMYTTMRIHRVNPALEDDLFLEKLHIQQSLVSLLEDLINKITSANDGKCEW